MREAKIQPGSKSIGARTWGHPETWEASPSSPRTRTGRAADHVQALRTGRDRSERRYVPTVIPRSEGNEVTRDGRQGVGAPHSTDATGEPTRGTPWREGKYG